MVGKGIIEVKHIFCVFKKEKKSEYKTWNEIIDLEIKLVNGET